MLHVYIHFKEIARQYVQKASHTVILVGGKPVFNILEFTSKIKRDRSGTCPLKHRGETQFRTKFLCFLSFSKKGSYTGPWRKRSIISWVREMADPPWGRFSRSNQVPSPSSSSWRVTVSSSVSRSQ